MKKTLGGATAGLSTAKQMRVESAKIRAKEDQMFDKVCATLPLLIDTR